MVMLPPKMSGVPNCITQQICTCSKHMRGKLVLNVLERVILYLCCTLWERSKSDLFALLEAKGAALALQQFILRSTIHDLVPLPACIENS